MSCFAPHGAQFLPGDAVCLACGTIVLVKQVTGRYIVFEDYSGSIRRRVLISMVYRQEVEWPWTEENASTSPVKYAGREASVTSGREYYVYFVKYMDKVVYIGKGKGPRWRHPNSGKSNCYELNQLHFRGEEVEVYKFAEGLTENEALELESEQIYAQSPIFNKMGEKSENTLQNSLDMYSIKDYIGVIGTASSAI